MESLTRALSDLEEKAVNFFGAIGELNKRHGTGVQMLQHNINEPLKQRTHKTKIYKK